MFKISCLVGRRPMKETFWETIYRTDHSVWFIGWVLCYFCGKPVKNPSIWKESLTWIVPRIRSIRGWMWKGDILVADIEELETMDASEIYSERLNAKEVIFPKQNGKFIFPITDGRINLSAGDQELRTPTLIRERPIRGEGHVNFLGETEGSLPPHHESFPDAGEAMNDFWSMSGSFVYRNHVEPRVKLYSPREESFPIPLKYIDVSRTTKTNMDVTQESLIDDYWNTDGSRDLSDSWTGFTEFTPLEERNLPTDLCGPGWQNGKRHPAQTIYGQSSGSKWQEMLSWRRNTNGPMINRNSIMPEIYEGSISSTRKTRNSKKPLRMLTRSWKCRWLLLCLARQARHVTMVRPVAKPMRSNQNLRASWKPVNPQDCVWKNLYRIMKTILQEKGQFTATLQFVSQINSYAPSHEDSRSKSSSGQGIGETGKDSGVGLDESQK